MIFSRGEVGLGEAGLRLGQVSGGTDRLVALVETCSFSVVAEGAFPGLFPSRYKWNQGGETRGSEACCNIFKNGIHMKGHARDPSKSRQHRIFSLLARTHFQSNLWSRSRKAFKSVETAELAPPSGFSEPLRVPGALLISHQQLGHQLSSCCG